MGTSICTTRERKLRLTSDNPSLPSAADTHTLASTTSAFTSLAPKTVPIPRQSCLAEGPVGARPIASSASSSQERSHTDGASRALPFSQRRQSRVVTSRTVSPRSAASALTSL